MGQKKSADAIPEAAQAVYAISMAAEMLSMQIQNLRVYERHGLVTPERTAGGTRLYSRDDLTQLMRVKELLAEGHNLVGVARIIALEDENAVLRAEIESHDGGNAVRAVAAD